MADKSKYFAAEDKETLAAYLQDKGDEWYQNLSRNHHLEKVEKSWHSYHGNYYANGHQITFGGDAGEMVNLPVNHYRNIANHIVTMITSTRPAFQPKATNIDYKTQVQTVLAQGLLEYYMRDKRLEIHLKRAVEYAVVLGAGYVKMDWNATAGDIYDYVMPDESEIVDYNEDGEPLDENGRVIDPYPIYEGDVEFRNLSPLDVVFDMTKESYDEHKWVLVRTFKNKYDIAEKYPEKRDEILSVETKNEKLHYRMAFNKLDETTDIPVYEFFHLPTESLPDGRYMLYIDNNTVLMDTPMPYRKLPVYRIAPHDILGTPLGYSPMFDLMPLQDAVNTLYSTVLTNQSTFGVQNILNPRGNDVRVNQVEDGLNFIEYNPQFGAPQPLNLTQTPAEIFNYMNMLVRDMETISGVNSVARGNPEANLRSGNSLALVQSQALQFVNGLQQAYVMMIEDVGTGLIQMLKDFAKVPRVAEIAGDANKAKMEEFTGDDLSEIRRVIVDVGNALSSTPAGRTEMADNLLQMGLIDTPEKYMSVISTGKLETMTQSQMDENMLIRAENERLMDGKKPVQAHAIDRHAQHIREHRSVIADPDLRLDGDLVQRVQDHIQEHINLLRETDPALLATLGEQSIAPLPGSQPGPGQMQPQDPNQQGGAPISQQMMNEQAYDTAPQNPTGLPQPAEPPIDPATGLPLTAKDRPLGGGQ